MTVRAIRVERTGGPEVMQPADIDLEAPGPGQVRIRIAAVGVNFVDIYQREGRYQMTLPYVPGGEGSGEVVEVGPGVTEVRVGERVAWQQIPGSYAAEVVGPVAKLISVPDSVSDQVAGALLLQGITAHYLATASYPIRPGDAVLIHAGAGGVGLLFTQIAKILGATVITTASKEKQHLCVEAGADHVLDYDGFDVAVRDLTGGIGVPAVYDGVGKETFDRSIKCLRRRGTMVLFGAASGPVPPIDPMVLMRNGSLSLTRPTGGDFVADQAEFHSRAADLLGWIAAGRLVVRVGGAYPLEDAARAHEDLEARRTTGKLLLLP
jgi:NADPH:quinone reductase